MPKKMMANKVWVIGAGFMAVEHIKVLLSIGNFPQVICRSEESAARIKKTFPELNVFSGGVEAALRDVSASLPSYAIVAVSNQQAFLVTQTLIESGVQNILSEKPAALSIEQARHYATISSTVNLQVAYNRRFFGSVLTLREILMNEVLQHFRFDFTEWLENIGARGFPKNVLENWFFLNSTHVVDLAFHIGGAPTEMQAWTSKPLEWHPDGSVFSGAGRTEMGVLFEYSANWGSASRWQLAFTTDKHSYVLCPMEELTRLGKDRQREVIARSDDGDLKAGLTAQLQAFLAGQQVCPISEHLALLNVYRTILKGGTYLSPDNR